MKIRTYACASVLATLGLLASVPANALGLGNLTLSSALNEPFKAEITITSLTGQEAGNLQVGLASNEEFARAGLIKNAVLSQLKFDVVEKGNATVVVISSQQAVKEPLMDFLVSATTGDGQLLREYTVLLDPPKSVYKPPVATMERIETTAAPTAVPSQSSKATRYQQTQSGLSNNRYGPIRSSETLWEVALKTRPEQSITVQQMMMALLEENSDAFIRRNINGLKAGYTLDIPSVEQIKNLTTKQALEAVKAQHSSWADRNSQPAVAVAEQATSTEQVPTENGENQVSSTTDQADTAEPEARLQLLSPTEEEGAFVEDELAALGNEQVKDLSEQLTLAQQTIEEQAQENQDIKARMDAMEEQVQTMRKLLSIQDPEWAKLQSKLEQEGTSTPIDDTFEQLTDSATELLTPEGAATTETGTPSEVTQEPLTPEENAAEEKIAEQTKQQTEQTNSDTESAAAASTDSEPASLSQQILTFLLKYKIEAASAGLVLLIALLLLSRRGGGTPPRSGMKTWDEAVKEMEKEGGLSEASSAKIIATGAASDPITDENEGFKSVAEMTQDADVYVSYGDLDKAKGALLAAHNEEPDNQEVIHKLLFVLFKQQKSDEFVDIASKFEADKDSLSWSEVASWGQELAPEHPLFKQATDDKETEQAMADDVDTEHTSMTADQTAQSQRQNEDGAGQADITEQPPKIEDDELLAFYSDGGFDDQEQESDDDETKSKQDSGNDAKQTDGLEDDLLAFDIDVSDNDGEKSVEHSDADADADDVHELSFELEDANAEDVPELSFELEDANAEDVPELKLDIEDTNAEDVPELNLDMTDVDENDQSDTNNISTHDNEAETTKQEQTQIDDKASDVEFDLGDFEQIDESETKLDLALAYIDMGDPDGAKSILQEVVNEGDEHQKARAQEMLSDLS